MASSLPDLIKVLALSTAVSQDHSVTGPLSWCLWALTFRKNMVCGILLSSSWKGQGQNLIWWLPWVHTLGHIWVFGLPLEMKCLILQNVEPMDQVLPVPSMSVSTASGLSVFVLALTMEEQRLPFFQSWWIKTRVVVHMCISQFNFPGMSNVYSH